MKDIKINEFKTAPRKKSYLIMLINNILIILIRLLVSLQQKAVSLASLKDDTVANYKEVNLKFMTIKTSFYLFFAANGKFPSGKIIFR